MSKSDVSEAISEAERNDPRLVEQRKRAKERKREATYGRELVEEETAWNEFASKAGYMLAIYEDKKGIVVDVLQVNEAYINGHGKLVLSVAAPEVVKDRDIGTLLEWEDHFELPLSRLLHYEDLRPGLHFADIEGYRRIVERGLKLAKKL